MTNENKNVHKHRGLNIESIIKYKRTMISSPLLALSLFRIPVFTRGFFSRVVRFIVVVSLLYVLLHTMLEPTTTIQ